MKYLKTLLGTLSFFTVLSLASVAFANEASETSTRTFALSFDRYYSPAVGSDLFLSLLHGVQTVEDRWLPQSQGDSSVQPVLSRTGPFILESLLWNTATTAQHEIFGHGFRAREFHMSAHYRVNIGGGGRIGVPLANYNALSYHEKAAFNAGGMEGNSLLA